MKWIKKSRKREKELAEKRARELAEMDKGFEGVQYDSADLSGMKVSHDMAEFEDGGEVILTLKDRGILDEEDEDGIELTNVNLEERERLRKNQENKKKKPGYNVYDDEEFTIGGASKNLLSQYDEELEGPKRTSFVIGQEGRVGQDSPAQQKASIAQKLKAQAVDLSYEKMQEVKDYYTQEEAALTFKKPKKKKKVRRRVAEPQDDEEPVEKGAQANVQQDNSDMAVDEPAAAPVKKSFDEENFVDDDDLQQALARTRRIANKKKQQIQRFTPEDIARNIAQQREAEQLENQNADEADSGLVISDTSEFVNSLSMDPVIEREKRERERQQAEADAAAEAAAAASSTSSAIVTEMQLDSDEDVDMENTESQEAKADHRHENNSDNEEEALAVVDEPLVSRGMAATLALLNQKGMCTAG
jgi:U4/U6.U5 tri-snRNP-associated protein 1